MIQSVTETADYNPLYETMEDLDGFEKITRRAARVMPVAAHRAATSGSHKTARSRRATRDLRRRFGSICTRHKRNLQW